MDYCFISKVKVYFRDIDSMRHVNNAAYLSYLEIARMDLYDKIFGIDGFKRYPYIIGELHIRYISPAKIKEILEIGIKPGRIGKKSFEFLYQIREESSKRLICEARTTQVMYDYETNSTVEISQDFISTLLSWFSPMSKDCSSQS